MPTPVAKAKKRIQALVREIAIKIYGDCVLASFPAAGKCGGYRNDGGKILQAEHLVSRARNISYGDMRNIILLCQRHHGFWKPQNSRLYWELIEGIIGPERWEWIKKVERDQKAYHMVLNDWLKIEVALKKELENL